jgi:hypothetical protein
MRRPPFTRPPKPSYRKLKAYTRRHRVLCRERHRRGAPSASLPSYDNTTANGTAGNHGGPSQGRLPMRQIQGTGTCKCNALDRFLWGP